MSRARIAAAEGEDPRVLITYERITPGEDDEEPEVESGWEEEDGIGMAPDADEIADGVTAAAKAAEFLRREGATDPSSSFFHPGIWYSTGHDIVDYGTGTEEQKSYHLKGFSRDEEREVHGLVTARRSRAFAAEAVADPAARHIADFFEGKIGAPVCGSGMTRIEILHAHPSLLGEHDARVCVDPQSPTGVIAVVPIGSKAVVVSLGERNDLRAEAILARSAALVAEYRHGPEPVQVRVEEFRDGPLYTVKVLSGPTGRWITQGEARKMRTALENAAFFYPPPGGEG